MSLTLVVAEKPSVAQAIAAVLGAKKRGDGCLQGGGYIVSWCYGHLVELAAADAYGEKYKHWTRDALPILPQKWQYTVSKDKSKQLAILRGLMNRADVSEVVCATDAGREGELIFRLVYNQCKCKKPVQRLWISSMEDSAINDGFNNLRPCASYDNLYHAALCRSQADWLVGINATRLFSCLYGATLNIGRVQSPTLAMIVDREAAVRQFQTKPFYTTEIYCGEFTASGDKLKAADEAEAIRLACHGHKAVCVAVEKKHKTTAPPKLYDLTTLQREANRHLGFTAQQTLEYLQALYEKKLVTYPRTDSRYLTSDMASELPTLVQMAAGMVPFTCGLTLVMNTTAVINDAKVTDHHAILPTKLAGSTDLSSLPAGERDILLMVTVRLLCATEDAHKYEVVKAVLECCGYSFTAKGRTVLEDGWKTIDSVYRVSIGGKQDKEEDESGSKLPELQEGQLFPQISASVREGKTSPPRRFTEDTLLSAMETAGTEDMAEDAERKGLGTPATRAAIIEKLIKTGFVERVKKNLIPTAKGIDLVAVLPDKIKSPVMTAEWEQKLKFVEQGKLTDAAFMAEIGAMITELVKAHANPDSEYAGRFAAASGNGGNSSSEALGCCPRCGGGVVEGPKGFFCSSSNCGFALWKNNRFFTAKKKKLTKNIVAALLKEGRVFMSGLYSEKTGSTYDATVVMVDTGEKFVQFKLEFDHKK